MYMFTVLRFNQFFYIFRFRDDGITLGMYLTIDQVEPSDFGDYVCSASNTGDQITERTSQIARNGELPFYFIIYYNIGLSCNVMVIVY